MPAPTETPWWKEPANVSLGKEIGKGLGLVVMLLIVVFGVIKPALRAVTERRGSSGNLAALPMNVGGGPSAGALPAPTGEQSELDKVKQIAKNDPAIVANVVRQWVGNNG
jgi:flagellar M-ring protein FliF